MSMCLKEKAKLRFVSLDFRGMSELSDKRVQNQFIERVIVGHRFEPKVSHL